MPSFIDCVEVVDERVVVDEVREVVVEETVVKTAGGAAPSGACGGSMVGKLGFGGVALAESVVVVVVDIVGERLSCCLFGTSVLDW